MILLAVDTSCDESSAAILDTKGTNGPVLLADVVHSHVDRMKSYGGVVPEIASREHLRGLPLAVNEALTQAGLKAKDLDWLVSTNRPGLIGALLVGVSFTKSLAYALGRPYTALDHIDAHLFSALLGELEGKRVPGFPWVTLVVSGGHTELFHVEGPGKSTHLGGTLDDAAGEAFDKVGKLLGLGYPAGPLIDKLVREKASDSDRTQFAFPRAVVAGFDFSFSGLKTAVSLQVRKLGELDDTAKISLLASAQEAILDPLVAKTREAANEYGASIVVTGGVACNSRLREKLQDAYFPSPRHCTDNAAMVALLAHLLNENEKLEPSPWTESAYPRRS